MKPSSGFDSVAVVIVAYNAESTIEWVLDRIPASFARSVGAVLVSDDASRDATVERAQEWAETHQDVAVTVVRQTQNRGYGGNQKFCYRWAIRLGFQHVVMIHGDGQYAPELAMAMVMPLLDGRAEAVFGSRMLTRGSALKGGMPLYKYVGNRFLTWCQNMASGLRLSEWHSGYRAYSASILDRLAFDSMADGFEFDTQIILGVKDGGGRIVEIPIPTYYGAEKCHVNGMQYAADVLVDVVKYRSRRALGTSAESYANAL
jgi:glycosyltransferase involved in cell wall biosynthesis